MEDFFEIPVCYNEKEMFFPARLLNFGYIHKFEVEISGQLFYFEQDDSGEYRAVIDPSNMEAAKKTDTGLLKAIADSIETILR